MTATATRPGVDEPKRDRSRKARFAADGNGLVLVVEPQEHRVNGQGKIVPLQGTGKRIEFKADSPKSQLYETRDPKELEWLRNHPLFARRVFVEVPVPKPPSAPVIAKIAELGVDHDIEALVALHAEEEAGWEREDVLEACTETLKRVEAAATRQEEMIRKAVEAANQTPPAKAPTQSAAPPAPTGSGA
jgi:hypothetical protein